MKRNDEDLQKKTVSFNVAGMPDTVFADWKKNCIEEFGDCHWVKIMSDHLKAKQFNAFLDMYSQVINKNLDLEERLISLEKQINSIVNESKSEPKITLG
jgi:hypothetical protein